MSRLRHEKKTRNETLLRPSPFTDISHWMKKMCTENPSHLQTATTAALTALYCTPSDVNNEVASSGLCHQVGGAQVTQF